MHNLYDHQLQRVEAALFLAIIAQFIVICVGLSVVVGVF